MALKNRTRRRQIVTEFTCFLRLQWSINSIRSRNMMENLLKRKHQPFFSRLTNGILFIFDEIINVKRFAKHSTILRAKIHGWLFNSAMK